MPFACEGEEALLYIRRRRIYNWGVGYIDFLRKHMDRAFNEGRCAHEQSLRLLSDLAPYLPWSAGVSPAFEGVGRRTGLV
jgi:hypothetical protein